MKRISKILILLLALVSPAFAEGTQGSALFAPVPPGDSTYSRLQQLEQTGLLAPGASQPPLTRYEAARLILQARAKYREMVVAQVDLNMLPSAEDSAKPAAPPALPAETTAAPASSGPVSEPAPEDFQKAAENLTSLEDAYQYELKEIQGQKQNTEKGAADVEASQYELLKRLNGITEYPTIAWHGLGRVFGISQSYSGGNGAVSLIHRSTAEGTGYLDFNPEGIVDKEIRWNGILRYQTAFESNMAPGIDNLIMRRATMEFNAPWLSATLGDFDEAYTPLTLWNRDDLDLRYYPEMIAREDDTQKYESFFNQEPAWPFRGARVGTALAWPDSDFLDQFKISAMANMIRNGYNDTVAGGTYFGATLFTDVIFGAQSELKLKRWYLGGGTSLQLGVDAYAVVLDEPLNTNQPGSPYVSTSPSTWGHHYQVISLKPSADVGLGDDVAFGAAWENAFSGYQDDTRDSGTVVNDFALMAGPYLRFGHSKISFNYLDVGPYYYVPLAQTRQDDIAPTAAYGSNPTPELFPTALRGQFFLSDVPRAGGIYSFYDRTQDNTFPYGLATPNRRGGGLELDVKTLEKDALKLEGSVYLVQEISDNLVVNDSGTGFTPVDANPSAPTPLRTFTYVNVGPSLNLAPLVGLTEDLEIGTNVRFEQTSSAIGTLTSAWILGGIKVGILPGWDVAASFGTQQIKGAEAGYDGTTLARYSYIFDNSDLHQYQVFNIDGSNQSWRLSTGLKMNRNSSFDLDYDFTSGDAVPYTGTAKPGTLDNQYMEVTYEIEF